nr:phage portal protein [Pseudovibrio flavus]
MSNPVAYRCVRMIAENAASVSLDFREGETELTSHPFLDVLQRPHPSGTASSMLEAIYAYLLISGNAYIEGVVLDGALREMYVLRPDRIKVVTGAGGWVRAYDYQAGGGTVRLCRGEQDAIDPVLHLKAFHPLDDYYGMAPLEAAMAALDTHNSAADWNKALLDNAACPSGALIYGASDALNMTDGQFQRLKEELSDSYQGARNAGRPLLLEGGLEWKPMSMTPKDMDFIAAKNQSAREIALALGVPPMLLGIPGDNTYSTYQEANRAFWRQTILPLVNRVLEGLSGWVSPLYEKPVSLTVDMDSIEALSVERKALWDRVSNADFLSDEEKREAVGYDAARPA